ncbi:carbohydrate ABC transporter permease [Dactylosporangium sp. CA-233914]|uniref:carbohydrate ABC transporter permease n=1 Tax=Dactylosporangium sp. CA-233914 TaxID=3239934 RepID=UPI003D904175
MIGTSARPRRLKAGWERRQQRWGWIFITPFAIVFVAFLALPIAYSFWLSLHSSSITGANQFVWFANYARASTDPRFIAGLRRVALYAIALIPAQIIVATVGALLIDALASRFARAARLAMFLPYAIPVAIGALMWGFLYSPTFGPLAEIFGSAAPNLLRNGIFAALTNIVTWQWSGYFMIIIYAALQGVDPAIYEAARIDGANQLQIALRIKIPMIRSIFTLIVLFALIGALQFFTEPQVLSNVASGVITPDYTPNLYAYTLAFKFNQLGYASTISFALGFIVIACSSLFLVLNRRRNAR